MILFVSPDDILNFPLKAPLPVGNCIIQDGQGPVVYDDINVSDSPECHSMGDGGNSDDENDVLSEVTRHW